MGHVDEYRLRANLRQFIGVCKDFDYSARMQMTMPGGSEADYRILKSQSNIATLTATILQVYLDETGEHPETREKSDRYTEIFRQAVKDALNTLGLPPRESDDI